MKTKKPTSPTKGSTQDFTEIEAISEDVVMLRDGSCCLIIQVGAVNFGLLSTEEQNAMIYSFASLLNSLSFPVQIVILSKKMDISSYLDYLEVQSANQSDQNIKNRLIAYTEFIKTMVKKNSILEKNFYFVIPFNHLELGVNANKKTLSNKTYVFTRAKTALYPKRDGMLRLLKKTGLSGKVLYDQEVVELFYNLYNPSSTGRKLAPIKNYTDPISVA